MPHPTLVTIALLTALGLAPTARAYTLQTERVEMTDGVGLSTAVYLPDTGEAPWPTLLARSPYAMDSYGGGLVLNGLLLATNLGYAVVIQDTRGTGGSEGEAQPFSTDRQDGHETLAWLLTQAWCSGEIELVGASLIQDEPTRYALLEASDPWARARMVAQAIVHLEELVCGAESQHPEQWPKGLSWN